MDDRPLEPKKPRLNMIAIARALTEGRSINCENSTTSKYLLLLGQHARDVDTREALQLREGKRETKRKGMSGGKTDSSDRKFVHGLKGEYEYKNRDE